MKNPLRSLIPMVTLLAVGACAPAADAVKIRITLPKLERPESPLQNFTTVPGFNAVTYPPNAIADFQCYMLNVYGPGIGSEEGKDGPQPVAGCPYRGVTSDLISTSSSSLSVTVPAGPARTIQMIGFAAQGATTCPGGSFRDYERANPFASGFNVVPTYSVVQLGKATTDLYKDKSVTIKNTYVNSGGSTYPFSCPFTNGGAPLSGVGVPYQLVYSTQPVHGSTYTVPFNTQPVVQARDAFGTLTPSYTGQIVDMSAYSDAACTTPVNVLLIPTATMTNGVATFSSLQYNYAGSSIYIKASAPGLLPVCSILVTTI